MIYSTTTTPIGLEMRPEDKARMAEAISKYCHHSFKPNKIGVYGLKKLFEKLIGSYCHITEFTTILADADFIIDSKGRLWLSLDEDANEIPPFYKGIGCQPWKYNK